MNASPPTNPPPVVTAVEQPRKIAVWFLILTGLAGWFMLFGKTGITFITLGPWGWPALLLMVAILGAFSFIPPTAAWAGRLFLSLRAPSIQPRRTSTLTAGVLTAAYLLQTALAQHRELWPYVHDEFSYLIQARQFASGHLWMPAHPLARFFDSFQLFTSPVYGSAYFPGTAVLYVPGVWLHLPPFVTSLTIAAAIGGLLYRITTELIDGLAGWVALLLLWSDRVFRSLSVMTMAQAPLLLFGLLAIWCWLNWQHHRNRRWAVGVGLTLGLAAVTRPVDALCFAVPIGWMMALDVFRRDTGLRPVLMALDFPGSTAHEIENPPHGPEARVTVALLGSLLSFCAGAVPLLILQLMLNHGITGHLLETPFRLYADRDYPGTAYGFHPFDPTAHPASELPQKLALYREYRPMIQRHQPWLAALETLRYRLPLTLTQATPAPFPLLLPLLPIALVGLNRRRAVILAGLPFFLALYAGYVFFFSHYVLTAAAAVIAGTLIATHQLPICFPKHGRFHAVFWPLMISGLAIGGLPQWNSAAKDDAFDAPLTADVNRQLAALPRLPAIVLFTYDPKRNTNEEPVYNLDAATPDDCAVIRAHDLGAMNIDLFRYYAARQPARVVYRYDEHTRQLSELGDVKPLAGASTRMK